MTNLVLVFGVILNLNTVDVMFTSAGFGNACLVYSQTGKEVTIYGHTCDEVFLEIKKQEVK